MRRLGDEAFSKSFKRGERAEATAQGQHDHGGGFWQQGESGVLDLQRALYQCRGQPDDEQDGDDRREGWQLWAGGLVQDLQVEWHAQDNTTKLLTSVPSTSTQP